MEQSSSIPTSYYEFPNGYNINLTIEKFRLCEGLFNASNLSGISGGDLLGIPNVVINSAAMCDVDIRPVSVASSFKRGQYEALRIFVFAGTVFQSGGGWWEFTSSRFY